MSPGRRKVFRPAEDSRSSLWKTAYGPIAEFVGFARVWGPLCWEYNDEMGKMFFEKWRRFTPAHWRKSTWTIAFTTAVSLFLIGVAAVIKIGKSMAGHIEVDAGGLLFAYNVVAMLSYLLTPEGTSYGSRELALLGRQFRRAVHHVVSNAERLLGISPAKAAGFKIISWFLNRPIGTVYFSEVAARIDLLFISGRIISLLGSLVLFFGLVFWRAGSPTVGIGDGLLFSLGVLSTLGFQTIGNSASVQLIAASQIVVQIALLTVVVPLLISLYERNRQTEQQLRPFERRNRQELAEFAREHRQKYPEYWKEHPTEK